MNGTQLPVVGGDARVAALAKTILEDKGPAVGRPTPASPAVLREAVAHLEPACSLLDGAGRGGDGQAWRAAAGLRPRACPIPVIMFSTDTRATHRPMRRGARMGTSRRSQDAAFAAVLEKPFDLDELVALVVGVISHDDGPVPSSVGFGDVSPYAVGTVASRHTPADPPTERDSAPVAAGAAAGDRRPPGANAGSRLVVHDRTRRNELTLPQVSAASGRRCAAGRGEQPGPYVDSRAPSAPTCAQRVAPSGPARWRAAPRFVPGRRVLSPARSTPRSRPPRGVRRRTALGKWRPVAGKANVRAPRPRCAAGVTPA